MIESTFTTEDYYKQIVEAGEYIKKNLGSAEIAITLGSGLNGFVDNLDSYKSLKYSEIPNLPVPTIIGHPGEIFYGEMKGKKIFCLAGRLHAYEGIELYKITFLARIMNYLGVKIYIATNSSGGCKNGMFEGCIMAITDHINFFKRNPLAETFEHAQLGEENESTHDLYSQRLIEYARTVSIKTELQLFEGVYCGVCGPSYETHSEVYAGRMLGCSAFGMSTVPEVMVAKTQGMEVFAISMITNLAAGVQSGAVLTHHDVTSVANKNALYFTRFMIEFISNLEVKPTLTTKSPKTERVTIPSPLPQPKGHIHTYQHIQQTAKLFQGLDAQPHVLLYLPPGLTEKNLPLKTVFKEFSYKTHFPYFPHVSATSRRGRVLVAKLENDVDIYLLTGNALDSFACEEAVFLADLFLELGVTEYIQYVPAGTVDTNTAPIHSVFSISDSSDYTTVYPLSYRHFSNSFVPKRLFSRFEGLSQKLDEKFYLNFTGPSFPTPSEANVAKKGGIELVGCSNLSLSYALRANDVNVYAFGLVTHDAYGEGVNIICSDKFPQISSLILESSKLSQNNKKPSSPNKFTDFKFPQQVSYHLITPISQPSYDLVNLFAENLRKDFAFSDFHLAVFLPLKFHFFLSSLSDGVLQKSLPFELYKKEFNSYLPPGGKFEFWKFGNVNVLFLVGKFYMNEGHNFQNLTFLERLMTKDAMNITKSVIIDEIVSLKHAEKSLGSIHLIEDHVNLAGRNPLFGENVEKWGDRFYDLSNIYDKDFRDTFKNISSQNNLDFPESKFCFFVGPIFASRTDSIISILCNCSYISTSIAPSSLVLKHQGTKTVALGLVTFSIGEDGNFFHIDDEKLNNDLDMFKDLSLTLQKFISTLSK